MWYLVVGCVDKRKFQFKNTKTFYIKNGDILDIFAAIFFNFLCWDTMRCFTVAIFEQPHVLMCYIFEHLSVFIICIPSVLSYSKRARSNIVMFGVTYNLHTYVSYIFKNKQLSTYIQHLKYNKELFNLDKQYFELSKTISNQFVFVSC